MTGASALQVSDLCVRYGGVQALDHVSMSVEPGELVGLIGPNGAGKTTFIDAVCGFARATGTVAVGGVDVSGQRPHLRARHGLARTWQAADLFDDLVVRDNLSVATHRRRARAGAPPDPTRFLSALGCEQLADAYPPSLSQGQRKLVGVARALAAEPSVLLLDEPAAGLDVDESEQFGQHLRDIVAGGVAGVLIDHDMGLVLSVCDRLVVLEFGVVIASGTPAEVRADKRVVEAYLGAAAARTAGAS